MSVNKQRCDFSKKDENLRVYSLGVGRLGICIDRAVKAIKALIQHETNKSQTANSIAMQILE